MTGRASRTAAPAAVEERAEIPLVVVVIVTYGRAEDAMEAIASLLQSTHRRLKIIVCDNASPDRTLDRLAAFARGEVGARQGGPVAIARPQGPIDHVVLGAAAAPEISDLPALTLVDTGANRGYAGGNNVALRWLQKSADWDYGLVLNPDTVVEPSAIAELVSRVQSAPGLGVVGPRVLAYEDPGLVHQWGGGTYSRLRGAARLMGLNRRRNERPDQRAVEGSLAYVTGAAFFFTREFLMRTGLMDEAYFLYYEELDWCMRRGALGIGYAHDAVIYHRLGASIGSSVKHGRISPLSIYWQYRSRFRFARKFFPWTLPSVYLATYLDMLRMISTGSPRNAALVFRAVHGLLPDPLTSGQRRKAAPGA